MIPNINQPGSYHVLTYFVYPWVIGYLKHIKSTISNALADVVQSHDVAAFPGYLVEVNNHLIVSVVDEVYFFTILLL